MARLFDDDVLLPDIARKFIIDFDAENEVKPITFDFDYVKL